MAINRVVQPPDADHVPGPDDRFVRCPVGLSSRLMTRTEC